MTGPRLLFIITMAIATMCAALMFATHDAHYVIRWTARTSLVLFALAYVARPANALWRTPTTKWLLRERKWLGDGFAVSHLAHLFAIIAIAVPDWNAFLASQDPTILVALAMFIVLFAMAITSIDRVRAAMSRGSWNALHRTGMHMAWFVFFTTYAGRVSAAPVYALPVGALVAIALVRATAWRRAVRRKNVVRSAA